MRVDIQDRSDTERRIAGALRNTIHDHGPITKRYIGSAAKRIYGQLLCLAKEQECSEKGVKNEKR
jgi:hypothetical protein